MNREDSEQFGFAFKGKKKLNGLHRTFIYLFSAIQLFLCITIVAMNMNKEYSGISSSIMINRLFLGFIIVSIINWLIGWSVAYSAFEDKNKNKKLYYPKQDRLIGQIISIFTKILIITAVISFLTASLDFF